MKSLRLIGIIVIAIFSLLGFTSCKSKNNDEPTTTQILKPSIPMSLREGYEEKFSTYTSVVHRVKNKETNLEIYGRLFKKNDFDNTKKYPLLIMSHGYNSVGMDGSSGLVQTIIENNMLCYTFDFCGGGKLSRSEGTSKQMSVKTEMSDLNSVIDDLSMIDYIDTSKIILFGHSFGGLVSSLVASSRKDKIAGLILHAPALPMQEMVKEQYKSLDEIPEEVLNNNLKISKKFYEDIWNINVYQTIKNWDKDVLLMFGSKDMFISSVDKAVEAFGNTKTEKVIVEGASHDFGPSEYDIVKPNVLSYINKMINK